MVTYGKNTTLTLVRMNLGPHLPPPALSFRVTSRTARSRRVPVSVAPLSVLGPPSLLHLEGLLLVVIRLLTLLILLFSHCALIIEHFFYLILTSLS